MLTAVVVVVADADDYHAMELITRFNFRFFVPQQTPVA